MIVLDTNFISALVQAAPDPAIVQWLNAQPGNSVWTTAISVFESRFGFARLPAGRRSQTLQAAFNRALTQLGNQVLNFHTDAANETAVIAARLEAAGRTIDFRDVMIAGIVAARGGTLATRNTKHFIDAGIPLINPWQ